MAGDGTDAAQLAPLRLLALQKDIHKAVRTRQDEVATMLARAAIETLITGLYCIHEPAAVAQLQGEQMRMLPLMVKFMVDAGLLPRDVLDECIERLDLGDPAKGPDIATMAKRVDAGTGSSIATSLYDRVYRPASNLALHAGAASLLRHVRSDGSTARRPSRVWGRRSPARIADTCLGTLTAVLAQRTGVPCQHAARYADRHGDRALTPVITISLGGLARGIRPRQAWTVIARLRELGEYVHSGQDAGDPAVRTARIRAEMEHLLTIPGLDIPAGSLDPYLDYVAAKIASESTAAPAGTAA